MAWKNVNQFSLADDLTEVHSTVKGFDDIHDLIDRYARYFGLARNKARLGLMCVAHNIKRGMKIIEVPQIIRALMRPYYTEIKAKTLI